MIDDVHIKIIENNRAKKSPYLDLSRCGLEAIPEEIFDFYWLEELTLSNEWWDLEKREWVMSGYSGLRNNISNIPADIVKLRNLKVLRIGGNSAYPWSIRNIQHISHLTQLQHLDISSNNIEDISSLKSLTSLTSLNLSYNKIKTAECLDNLVNLKLLDLSFNQLPYFKIFPKFSRLELLNLYGNFIPSIFLYDFESFHLKLDFLTDKRRDYKTDYVYLGGNNFGSIPPDVMAQGSKFILQYLKFQDKTQLNECKIIITGRGKVGKTSLQKRLFGDEQFNPYENETHGIRKKTWGDGVRTVTGDYIKVHFWDMGGQQEQQTLHQLFYTENAVYILLLDKRIDEEPEFFLELIKVYGNSCPVIVVYNNKKDLRTSGRVNYNHNPEFDSTLLVKYPNIRKVMGVCCGQDEDKGIDELRDYLIDYIPTLDHVREKFPMEWIAVKNELISRIDKNYIKYKEYEQLCKSKNINSRELQISLAKMLNNTGTIAYFDELYLNYYILNPDWVTTGAYEIMLSPITMKNKGRLTAKDLKTIFKQKTSFHYETWDYEFLMRLMITYSLCHEFKENEEWLIPSSLQGQPNTNLVAYKKNGEYRLYCMRYRDALPRSIIHKFIARNITNAYKQDYWRNGIVVKHKDSGTLLFIEADYKEKEIRIWIKGDEILEAWKFFRKDFEDLSVRFEYSEMVEVVAGQNLMMSYKELMNLYKVLRKDQLENWYNPQLNMHIDVLKALALFNEQPVDKEDEATKTTDYADQERTEMELKRLQMKVNAFERDNEERAVEKWKKDAGKTTLIAIFTTIAVLVCVAQEFDFILQPHIWKLIKDTQYLNWGGTAILTSINSFFLKILYDRVYDISKEKAFREEWRRKQTLPAPKR
jgi:small GTP-binding protein